MIKPLFSLGKLLITPGAMELLEKNNQSPSEFLDRHIIGDWGDLCKEDGMMNDYAVNHDERILSAYTLKNSEKIWIITEADRSATTILKPDEY
jgi:hypothetical protein